MRAWFSFYLGVVVAIVATAALDRALSPERLWITQVIYCAIIVATALGTLHIRKASDKESRKGVDGTVEKEITSQAKSGSFGVSLVAMLIFGCYLLTRGLYMESFVLYVAVVAVLAAHWVRYAVIRRRMI